MINGKRYELTGAWRGSYFDWRAVCEGRLVAASFDLDWVRRGARRIRGYGIPRGHTKTEPQMNWRRASYDVMTLHFEDGEYAGYYVVRHKTSHGPYYNGWHGDFRDRGIREYVSAGFDRDAVMAACESRAKKAIA